MKSWLIGVAWLGLASAALADPPAPLAFPAGAEATEARIDREIGPLMRAWARSEASYASHVSQVGPDLERTFPQVHAGAQSDAIVFLVLMEKLRVEHDAIVGLQGKPTLTSEQQMALQQALDQSAQALQMISNLLKSLGESADAVIKTIKP